MCVNQYGINAWSTNKGLAVPHMPPLYYLRHTTTNSSLFSAYSVDPCLEQARHCVLDVGPAPRVHPRLSAHHVSARKLRTPGILR
jgi:hypothetical protein